MKPAFALLFSADGVVLMHRVAQGWVELGRALMADAGFAQSLADLRRMADDLDAGGGVKLVLPGDQILYTKVEALGPGWQKQRSQIKSALIGRTPYQVPDLAFDWVGAGPTVQVAVIARETLAEAEAFALEHGFEPISFVARPDPAEFTGEPFFGITAALPKGTRIPRDDAPVPDPDAPAVPAAAAVTDSLPTAPPVPQPLASAQLDLLDFAAKSEPKIDVQQPSSDVQEPAPDTPRPAPNDLSHPLGRGAPAKPAAHDADLPARNDGAFKTETMAAQPLDAVTDLAEPIDVTSKLDVVFEPDLEPKPEPELSATAVAQPQPKEIRDTATALPMPPSPTAPSPTAPSPAAPSPTAAVPEAPAAFDVPVQDIMPDPVLGVAAPVAIDAALPDVPTQQPGARVGPVSVISPSLPDIEPAVGPSLGAKPLPIPDPRPKVGRLGRAAVGAAGVVARVAVAQGLPKSEQRSGDPRPVLAARVRDSGPPIISPFQNPPPAPLLAQPAVLAGMGAVFLAVLALVLWWIFSDPVPEAVQEPVSSLGAEPGAFAEVPAASSDPVSDLVPDPASEVVVQAAPKDDSAAVPTDTVTGEGTPQATDLVKAATPDASKTMVETVAEVEATPEPSAQPLPDAVGQAIAASLQDGNGVDVGVADLGEGAEIPAPLPRPTRTEPQSLNADPQIGETQSAGVQGADDTPPALIEASETETITPVPTKAEPQMAAAAPVLDAVANRVPQTAPADMTVAEPKTEDPVLSEDQPTVRDVPVLAVANTAVTAQPVTDLRPADPIPQLMPPPALVRLAADAPPKAPTAPPPFGATFARDARGLILATPDGALTPEGAVVFSNLRVPAPIARPRADLAVLDIATLAQTAPNGVVTDPEVAAALLPPARPAELAVLQVAADASLIAEPVNTPPLPKRRPAVLQARIAVQAQVLADMADASRLALSRVAPPKPRPQNFNRAITAALAQVDQSADVDEPEPVVAPSILPTKASVAKQATLDNAINLRDIALIGVFGKTSERKGLVRMPNGRIVTVKLGDTLDGGKVVAIGAREVRYVKSGKNVVLNLPKG